MRPSWPAALRDSAGTGDDPLGKVVTSGHGTDADAGDYLTDDAAAASAEEAAPANTEE